MSTCPVCANPLPADGTPCLQCAWSPTAQPSPWAGPSEVGPAASMPVGPPSPSPYAPGPHPGSPAPPPYGYGGFGFNTGPGTNGMAIGSLITSIGIVVLTLVTCGFGAVFAPVGAVLGHVALSQIKRTGQEGRGMAVAGVIIGWVLTGLAVLGIVAFIAIGLTSSGAD